MFEIVLNRFLAYLFWVFVLGVIFALLEVRDWWKYHPYPQRLKCAVIGHDYHDGKAKNLKITRADGTTYIYDFCQRCYTEQNRREVLIV